MISTIVCLAVACALLAYLLVAGDKKNSKLLAENHLMKGRVEAIQEIADKITAKEEARDKEEAEAMRKPMSADSIRAALRYNGISPDVPDTEEPNIVYFQVDDVKYRINAEHLPFLSIDMGYGLKNEPKENISLMTQAAAEVTSRMFVGKAYILDGEAVVFSAELLCDSYMHLRNNFKHYLDILSDVHKRFDETREAMLQKRKEECEAVFSGSCFVQEASVKQKVQS